ncbi:DUF4210 domain-containing protein [Luteimonas granuli]|uniref:DUF4210 domain-containing protein n=1 Tax=Luteimonas granuli TaxID=1176533 RepID=A0A518N711_9GAMM|nr:DUF4210 domain-containing protein [Luteimonas granuli]
MDSTSCAVAGASTDAAASAARSAPVRFRARVSAGRTVRARCRPSLPCPPHAHLPFSPSHCPTAAPACTSAAAPGTAAAPATP